jgi:hypothetical protein
MPELLTIVTGASSNHFRCLKNLLHTIDAFEPRARAIVYDLGLTEAERRRLVKDRREVRRFDFAKYPPHVDIRVNRGAYAWKPIIVAEVVNETKGMVLWLDAGDLLERPLGPVRQTLRHYGFFSPLSEGTIGKWTHPGTRRFLRVPPEWLRHRARCAGIAGFNGAVPWARRLADRWRRCALDPDCIAPRGSNLNNHRYDLAILSVLSYEAQQRHSIILEDQPLGISVHNDELTRAEVRRNVRALKTGILSPRLALKHLILVPRGGLANRLRAIASARRFCRVTKVKLSLVWDWGDFTHYFKPISDVEFVSRDDIRPDKQIIHYPMRIDPSRKIDFTVKTLELHTGYIFTVPGTQAPRQKSLLAYYPKLSARLTKIVDDFSRKHLRHAVGVHIRRTDNTKSIFHSPDELFIACLDDLVGRGKKIFLATDNESTVRKIKRRYGKAIITYPKKSKLRWRWPRPQFDPLAVEEDLIDLFLLVRCQYIVGSYWSSFSELARLLNGSKRSGVLFRSETNRL